MPPRSADAALPEDDAGIDESRANLIALAQKYEDGTRGEPWMADIYHHLRLLCNKVVALNSGLRRRLPSRFDGLSEHYLEPLYAIVNDLERFYWATDSLLQRLKLDDEGFAAEFRYTVNDSLKWSWQMLNSAIATYESYLVDSARSVDRRDSADAFLLRFNDFATELIDVTAELPDDADGGAG